MLRSGRKFLGYISTRTIRAEDRQESGQGPRNALNYKENAAASRDFVSWLLINRHPRTEMELPKLRFRPKRPGLNCGIGWPRRCAWAQSLRNPRDPRPF